MRKKYDVQFGISFDFQEWQINIMYCLIILPIFFFQLFMLSTLLFLLHSLTFFHPTLSCTSDINCEDCQFYVVRITRRGIQGYYFCQSCSSHRQVNPVTDLCQCEDGYYQQSNTTCALCPSLCNQCSSQNYCTECKSQLLRQINNGKCVCIQGYEQVENSNICEEKKDILMMVLSSAGSVGCLILSALVCAVLRYKRNAQVRVEGNRRKSSQKIQIQVYQEQMEQSSNSVFTSKFQYYKPHEVCSICLDEGTYFITECGHYFHGKCLFCWLENKNTCPNCNKELKSKDIRRWCEKCEKALMPVIKNVLISKKKKREILKSMPIDHQICDQCEKQEKNTMSHDKDGI